MGCTASVLASEDFDVSDNTNSDRHASAQPLVDKVAAPAPAADKPDAFRSKLPVPEVGNTLQVAKTAAAVINACQELIVNSQIERDIIASAGKHVVVESVDVVDETVLCVVPDVGKVWLAFGAVFAL